MPPKTISPIVNYTTKIPVEKTVGEIIALLASKGANNINMSYEDGVLSGVRFVLPIGGTVQVFQLPENAAGVAAVMRASKATRRGPRQKESAYEESLMEQARMTAWRILKAWVEIQFALVDSAQATAVQVFLPYAVDNSGATYYEAFLENHNLRLGAGS